MTARARCTTCWNFAEFCECEAARRRAEESARLAALRARRDADPVWKMLDDLCPEDPNTYTTEGLDDGCLWCDAPTAYGGVQVHDAGCAWARAVRFLGRPMPDGHDVAGAVIEAAASERRG